MAAATTKLVFIDGEAGTTGLEIRERLAGIAGLTVKSIDAAKRKDADARRAIMAECELVVLCLPDDAAKDAVELAGSLGKKSPKIVDASTVHRTAPGWVYGFAELDASHVTEIARAKLVSNPGCYPTGAIALLHPLVASGVIPADTPLAINAVSGYSGGGKSMIESYEVAKAAPSFELYGLGLAHKHVPEITKYSGLTRRPIFVPSVGNFRQGMLVSIPLHLDTLPGKPTLADVEAVLAKHYAKATTVRVITGAAKDLTRLEPEALNGTNKLELFVFGKPDANHALLVARLDNLGKGAAGAAVQNIKLMLGLA